MKASLLTTKIRKLGTEEPIPYDLLLLADETKEAIDEYIHTGDIFVIEEDEVIVAVYVLHAVSDLCVEIKNIAVTTELQGIGIGNLLLADAIARAVSVGYHEIVVGTPDVSHALIRFYQSAGFVAYGKKKNFYIDHYPGPIIENGIRLVDMLMLKKTL